VGAVEILIDVGCHQGRFYGAGTILVPYLTGMLDERRSLSTVPERPSTAGMFDLSLLRDLQVQYDI